MLQKEGWGHTSVYVISPKRCNLLVRPDSVGYTPNSLVDVGRGTSVVGMFPPGGRCPVSSPTVLVGVAVSRDARCQVHCQ